MTTNTKRSFIFLFWITLDLNLTYGQIFNHIVAKGAKVTLLDSSFSFTEGPAADKSGNVYFTDQPNDRILKWSMHGPISVFMNGCGRSNGLYFDKLGNLLACADEKNELWQINPQKEVKVLLRNFEGKRLNGPNDLWVHPNGGIYFTDPYYKRDYWQHQTPELEKQCVYYFNPVQNRCVVVADDLLQPNGIIGTPDGTHLYVADIRAWKTYSYTIKADGSLADKKLFCELGSDGMTIDQKGNVYLTGRGVTVFSKLGVQILKIPIPQPWTANITFGGKKRKTLFITASKAVYTLDMKVKGA